MGITEAEKQENARVNAGEKKLTGDSGSSYLIVCFFSEQKSLRHLEGKK